MQRSNSPASFTWHLYQESRDNRGLLVNGKLYNRDLFERCVMFPKLTTAIGRLAIQAFVSFSAIVYATQMPAKAAPSPHTLVLLHAPSAPTLRAISGGRLAAHTDYVRVTLVTEHGETVPSPEATISVLDDSLTVVRSPRPVKGSIGYNVYAVANNGGSGTGEMLQNSRPIPFGRNVVEPLSGWKSGRQPPSRGSAFVSARMVPHGFMLLPPPPPPQLLPQASLPARSDYVRITYVMLNGRESGASAEAVNSAIANTLTVVLSPPPVNGAIGYNVYATQNNGGTGTGEMLQNSRPVPLWTNFTEPATGWIQGPPPPTNSNGSGPMKPPISPTLSSITLPTIDARTDYVVITYVTSDGETASSAERAISEVANCLTVVQSPPAVNGVIGYNVYAVKNNGGSGVGETLQNRQPIPIGKDFIEPISGWGIDGFEPPADDTATVPLQPPPTKRASHAHLDRLLR